MRWFRRLLRFFPALVTVFAVSFTFIFVINTIVTDNDVAIDDLRFDHGYTSDQISSFASPIHVKSFRPSYYLRRNSSKHPATEWRSPVKLRRLLDINDFEFLINSSHVCLSRAPFLMAIVHSSPSNFQKRAIIRRTWASIKQVNGLRVSVAFIVGLVTDTHLQDLLERENRLHQDLVQGRFLDSYHNLTYKHLAGYKWLLHFCNDTKFVMKVDDDAFIDIFKVVTVLKETFDPNDLETPKNIIACSVFPDGTLPKRQGKWSLTLEQYPFPTYPSYCSGVAYFLTTDVVYDILEAAHKIHPVLRIDDVFLTGIVAAALRLRHLPLNLKYTYQANKLREWLHSDQVKPSPFMVGDIGDINGKEWENLMLNLWRKTVKSWSVNGLR